MHPPRLQMAGEHRRKSRSLKKQNGEFRMVLIWMSLKYTILCIVQCVRYLWQHNPVKVISQRQRRLYFVESYDGVIIKPKFRERVVDLLLTDYRRRQRLLHWVHAKLRSTEVHDFSTYWQDGTVLCALLESICPGVCPSFHLLSPLNMVKNCRLGIKLANKYLYVPMDLLSPEEMAIATPDSEFKIIQYISMIKWASQNIKEKWSTLHQSLIAAKTGRCFAKSSGVRNGIVGKRSKFPIVVSDTIGVFNLLVEIRGPNNEYSGERIVSLHQAKGVLEKTFDKTDSVKYLEDGVGNTFVRKKIPPRYAKDTQADHMFLDFHCGEEGTFYVTFVPRRAGIHTVAVKWQNHHVENSPFRIKVYKASNISTKYLKGAHEKRVIYDSLSLATLPVNGDSFDIPDNKDRNSPGTSKSDPGLRALNAVTKSKAYSKARQLTVTGRRVLRRVITRNGEDIVIEETVSPSLSRQSSITDNSDEDNRFPRREREDRRNSPLLYSTTGAFPSPSPAQSKNTPPKPLGTVPEEKQNSKENLFKNINLNEAISSTTMQQSLRAYHSKTKNLKADGLEKSNFLTGCDVNTEPEPNTITSSGKPLIKYTCTELSEHNILEPDVNCDGDLDREDETPRDNGDNNNKNNNNAEVTSLWFNQPSTLQNVRVNRSPRKGSLQRTMSISENRKPTARRSISDSTIYKLQRRIASMGTSDISETSSEISSDDKQSGAEDEFGVSGPALKLLKSQSLRKACLYISDNATARSVSGDVAKNEVNSNIQLAVKAKLRATQSPGNTDVYSEGPLQSTYNDEFSLQEIDIMKQVPSEPDETSLNKSNGWLNDSNNSFVNTIFVTNGVETIRSKTIHKQEPEVKSTQQCTNTSTLVTQNGDKSNERPRSEEGEAATPRVISRHEQIINQNMDGETFEICRSPDKKSVDVWHKTSLFKDFPSPKTRDRPTRVSDTKMCNTENEEGRPTDSKLSLANSTISLQSSKNVADCFTSTRETTHLLQVHLDDTSEHAHRGTSGTPSESQAPLKSDDFERCDIPNMSSHNLQNSHELHLGSGHPSGHNIGEIRLDDLDIYDNKKTDDLDIGNGSGIDDNERDILAELDQSAEYRPLTRNHMGKHKAVEDWFRRNEKLMRDGLQQRQVTVDTVDSGFDDNPTHFNRHARFSLPSLGTVNGHTRLHRRPYRGQIALDPRLVNSLSSQSASQDYRDLGNEADDELLFNSSIEHRNVRTLRRRHKLKTRENTFSFSDSEIDQRRFDARRRVFGQRGRHETQFQSHNAGINSQHALVNDDVIEHETHEEPTKTKHLMFTRKRMEHMDSIDITDEENIPANQSVLAGTEHSSIASEQSSQLSTGRKRIVTRKSTATTSMDSNYCGFGVTKGTRSALLSHLGDFQNLCTTEEIPDEGMPIVRSRHDINLRELKEDDSANVADSGITSLDNRVHVTTSNNQGIHSIYVNGLKPEVEFDHDNDNYPQDNTVHVTIASGSNLNVQTGSENSDVNTDNLEETPLFDDDVFDDGFECIETDNHLKLLAAEYEANTDTSVCDSNEICLLEGFDGSPVQRMLNGIYESSIFEDGLTDDEIHADGSIRVDGAGLHHGLVGETNSFQVWTENLPTGSLAINVIGPRPHTVTETSVLYTGDNLYEVSYGVTHPGFYKIFVKWDEENIANSPFVCEVTF